jgi:hypothetical protein
MSKAPSVAGLGAVKERTPVPEPVVVFPQEISNNKRTAAGARAKTGTRAKFFFIMQSLEPGITASAMMNSIQGKKGWGRRLIK